MSDCTIDANIIIQNSIIAQKSEIFANKDPKSRKKLLLGEGTKIVL